MKDYKDLNIFRTPKELPKKNVPLGLCIYNKDKELSNDEMKILSKQPKFSIIGNVARTDMLLEKGRMLGKHRFNEKPLALEKESITTARIDQDSNLDPSIGLLARGGKDIGGPSNGLLARGGNNINDLMDSNGNERKKHTTTFNYEETTRQQELGKIWQENEERFT